MPRFHGKVVEEQPTQESFKDGSEFVVIDSSHVLDPSIIDRVTAANMVFKITPPHIDNLGVLADWIIRQKSKVPPQTVNFLLDMPFLPRPTGRVTQDVLVAFFSRIVKTFERISLLVSDPKEEKWQSIHALALPSGCEVSLQFQDEKVSFLEKWKTQNIQFVFLGPNNLEESKLRKILPFFPNASLVVEDSRAIKFVKNFARRLLNPTHNMLIDPLTPLSDDLALVVYDQFEKDENKYNQYKKAIALALEDLKHTVPVIHVLVVGPGKGKLIDKLFEVATTKMNVVAVEKNEHCISILMDKNSRDWNSEVLLIHDDIRTCPLDNKPHLVISELLGSFGDNELSAEVLARFNPPSERPVVMIPTSYTNFLQPIYTSILPKTFDFERPFLSHLTLFSALAEPISGWTYFHPSEYGSDVSRTITFVSELDYPVNAFYGFFNANLYGHFNISILTEDKGRDEFCMSWYPMIFPVTSTAVAIGEKLTITISRKHLEHRIWYEWEFNGKVYNRGGKEHHMGLA